MSLKSFHIIFVTLSSLLAFVFGGWSFRLYQAQGNGSDLALSLASFAVGLVLIVYGFWFWKKITTREEEEHRRRKRIHPLPIMIALWIVGTRSASACSVCYGEAEGPMIDAARMGVYLLFGMVLFVQAAFGMFFYRLWRRTREIRQAEESFQP